MILVGYIMSRKYDVVPDMTSSKSRVGKRSRLKMHWYELREARLDTCEMECRTNERMNEECVYTYAMNE